MNTNNNNFKTLLTQWATKHNEKQPREYESRRDKHIILLAPLQGKLWLFTVLCDFWRKRDCDKRKYNRCNLQICKIIKINKESG